MILKNASFKFYHKDKVLPRHIYYSNLKINFYKGIKAGTLFNQALTFLVHQRQNLIQKVVFTSTRFSSSSTFSICDMGLKKTAY